MVTMEQMLAKKEWSSGEMVARVANVSSCPEGKPPYQNYSLTEIQLSNVYGTILRLAFATPHGKDPILLLKDVNELNKQRRDHGRRKYWCVFNMQEYKGMLQIASITAIDEKHQSEIEQISALARGVFNNSNMFDINTKGLVN